MTTNVNSQNADDIIGWFTESLISTANAIGLKVTTDGTLASQIFQGGENQESAHLEASDLPAKVSALRIGRYSVLIGQLPGTPSKEAVDDTLRRFRNQSVIARSYLSPNEALDLQVFFVGPVGSDNNDKWSTLGLLIERDEKVARKITWLRPTEEANNSSSYGDFVKRTFLAEPWKHDGVFTMADLDSLSRIPELTDGSLARDTAQTWVQLTLKHQDDTVTLVDSLIEAWSKRGKA